MDSLKLEKMVIFPISVIRGKNKSPLILFLIKVVMILGFFLTWVLLLDLNWLIPDNDLDSSWKQALGYFVTHHYKAGKDFIFTFGPLGVFSTHIYSPNLFWVQISWEVILKGIFAWTIWQVSWTFSTTWLRLPFCLLLGYFGHQTLGIPDVFYLFILVVHFILIMEAGSNRFCFNLFARLLLITLLAWVKYTLFVFAGISCILILGTWIVFRRPLSALLLGFSFTACLLFWWKILGQGLENVIPYLRGSEEIANGYVEAMATYGGDPLDFRLVRWIVIFLGIALGSLLFSGKQNWSKWGIMGLALFCQWKHGFVRHDIHPFSFFSFSLLISLLMLTLSSYSWGNFLRIIGAAGIFFTSTLALDKTARGYHLRYSSNPQKELLFTCQDLQHDWKVLKDFRGFNEELHRQFSKNAEAFSLNGMKARIGLGTADLFSNEQGVLILNELNWKPRPVFQSYSAYTPYLIQLNQHFFQGSEAPEFILLHLAPIDGRPPLLEDSQAFLEIVRHYQPIMEEKSFLLLQKSIQQLETPLPATVLQEKVISFHEEIEIPDTGITPIQLTLDIAYSSAGKIRKFLFKPNLLKLVVKTTGGEIHEFRLVPGMAKAGFLINPLILTNYDVFSLYGSPSYKKVKSFCIQTESGQSQCFMPEIQMKLETRPELKQQLKSNVLNPFLYPGLDTYPLEVDPEAIAETAQIDGHSILITRPGGWIKFGIPKGASKINAVLGILPEAYENDQFNRGEFTIEFSPFRGASQVLFRRFLDPARDHNDRGSQIIEVPIPPFSEGYLIFRTEVDFRKKGSKDSTYWGGIKIN